jgi:hypothetical protein
MRLLFVVAALMFASLAMGQVSKSEKTVNFIPAKPDPAVGDWQGEGELVAQVFTTPGDAYQANLLKSFDTAGTAVAVLKGVKSSDAITFSGDGWTATIQGSNFTGSKGDEKLNLQHVNRTPPTLGATPPQGAVVLFDGKNLDAWATKAGKNWLEEAGPAKWKITDDGAMEVVPGTDSIISHQKFGDSHIHVEFRTLGAPTNSGVFIQNRYEVNINETYGQLEKGANGGLDNCTEKVPPAKRASLPPLAWQTLDIDFRAPRFDAAGKKTANARATVVLNGVKIYDNQALDQPHGAAGRFGEAPSGQLQLQEHGVPVQFRNIWVMELKSTD